MLLFCAGILDFSKPTRLPGNEAEVFQSLDWTLVNSLKGSGSFPLWNPYLMTGLPFVADPMLHSYNPFVTLPVLLLGVQAGFKVGVVLSFLLGALGMWWLALVLGMGRPARLWVALLFVFAGQPAARFFQGQYLFVLGFAWIPWVIAGLFRTAQTGRRRYVAVTVLSLGLLFFSGNAYYAFYMLLVLLLFALVMLFRFSRSKPYIHVDLRLLKRLAATGALALGLIAVQLLPLTEMWGHLSKSMELAGLQTVGQIFLDYTSRRLLPPGRLQPAAGARGVLRLHWTDPLPGAGAAALRHLEGKPPGDPVLRPAAAAGGGMDRPGAHALGEPVPGDALPAAVPPPFTHPDLRQLCRHPAGGDGHGCAVEAAGKGSRAANRYA